jgi:chromosome segregation ATPase
VEVKLTTSQLKSVQEYCKLNNIEDVDKFISKCFTNGLSIEKYGLLGDDSGKTGIVSEKQVEIEVIREIRVEIPVEVIREVEKIVEVIKEVTVEKVVIQEIIKEVPVDRVVEKIIYTTDDIQINELGGKIAELEEERQIFSTKIANLEEERQIFSTKTEEMENNFQNEISKKDKELGDLRQKLDDPITNDKIKLLQETLQNLRGEIQQKNEQIREIEKINRDLLNGNQNQAYLLRGSNLNKRV